MKKKDFLEIQRKNDQGTRLNEFPTEKLLKPGRLKSRDEEGFVKMRLGQI